MGWGAHLWHIYSVMQKQKEEHTLVWFGVSPFYYIFPAAKSFVHLLFTRQGALAPLLLRLALTTNLGSTVPGLAGLARLAISTKKFSDSPPLLSIPLSP